MRRVGGAFGLFLGGSLAVMAWAQSGWPPEFRSHMDRLSASPQLSATVTVQPLQSVPRDVKIQFARPNKFRVETDQGFVLCDGKSIFRYDKRSNSYREELLTNMGASTILSDPAVFLWAPFFASQAMPGLQSTRAGKERSFRGRSTREVELAFEKGVTGSVFVDSATGLGVGGTHKDANGNQVILSTSDLNLMAPIEESRFVFSPPPGAKKSQSAPTSGPVVTFAQVAGIFRMKCMGCHGANGRSGFSATSHASVMRGGNSGPAVKPGNPDGSLLIQYVKGQRQPKMPMGGSLSPAEINQLVAWVQGGAKP